jgi:hypothetical protein
LSEKDFIFSKSRELYLNGIKNFPIDFINSKNIKVIDIPEKQLVLGKEFFGSYEVSTIAGDFLLNFCNAYEAKYIVYASKNRKDKIIIPKEPDTIKSAVDSYEKYLDQLLQEVKKDYITRFSNGKNFTSVSNEIFKKLNLTRL